MINIIFIFFTTPFLLFMPVKIGTFYNTSYPESHSYEPLQWGTTYEGISEGFINGLSWEFLFLWPAVIYTVVAMSLVLLS